MAEEFEAVASSCKKKLKQRGPYNQYLSEPGAKIPRTTLKRWPKKTLETTSISPSADNSKDDLDLTSSKYSNATCVISSSVVTETAPAEVAYRFLHQTELSSEKASSIRNLKEYAVDYDENKLPFETQSDESNLKHYLVFGQIEQITKPVDNYNISRWQAIRCLINSVQAGKLKFIKELLLFRLLVLFYSWYFACFCCFCLACPKKQSTAKNILLDEKYKQQGQKQRNQSNLFINSLK